MSNYDNLTSNIYTQFRDSEFTAGRTTINSIISVVSVHTQTWQPTPTHLYIRPRTHTQSTLIHTQHTQTTNTRPGVAVQLSNTQKHHPPTHTPQPTSQPDSVHHQNRTQQSA